MIRQCLYCDKSFEAKRSDTKFCSAKCKNASFRNNKRIIAVATDNSDTDNVTVRDTDNTTDKLAKTDQLFQDDAVKRDLGKNWLVFSEIVRQPNCRQCGKKFKTKLQMLNYCSPDCRNEALSTNKFGL